MCCTSLCIHLLVPPPSTESRELERASTERYFVGDKEGDPQPATQTPLVSWICVHAHRIAAIHLPTASEIPAWGAMCGALGGHGQVPYVLYMNMASVGVCLEDRWAVPLELAA